MKNVWVISLRTSLPRKGYLEKHLKKTVLVFDSFEKARDEFRRIIKDNAFSKNTMFDGKGGLKQLSHYIKDRMSWQHDEDDDEEYDEDLSVEKLKKVEQVLTKFFSGEAVDLKALKKVNCCTDYYIAYSYRNGILRFFGDDDGPCNGYDPEISTNAFSMEKEQNYYLYINDRLGQKSDSSQFYLDLMSATLDD